MALFVYAPVVGFGFVNYDDNRYFTGNPHVLGGLTWENARWAFEIHGPSMWIPLTWLSHQAMVSLFGPEPSWHHGLNLAIHAANAFLLALWLGRATGRKLLGMVVAMFFAIHPIHVESVAWVTERKDVLSLFFCLLALIFHERRSRGGGPWSYGGMFCCHALAVMAKPLAVTLPCVMLLIEIWPLGRGIQKRSLWEKLPLLGMSALASGMTVLCQNSIGAIGSTQDYPLAGRAANAVVAHAAYLRKLVLPEDLAVFYPYPESIPVATWVGALLILSGISFITWRLRKEVPALLVGWLWFLGTMVPMSGWVQAGAASMADRYAYLPFIGLYLGLVWGVAECCRRVPGAQAGVLGGMGAAMVLLISAARQQVEVWKDSESLMRHALKVDASNHVAWNNLGIALEEKGAMDQARECYASALKYQPDYAEALSNLGVMAAQRGQLVEALDHLDAALAAEPGHAVAWHNLGKVRLQAGDLDGAREAFEKSMELAPEFAMPRYDLAVMEIGMSRWAEAIVLLEPLVAMEPTFGDAWANLGFALQQAGRIEEAERSYAAGARAGSEVARRNLEILRAPKER
ncbi:MAG: tetratricopeptide repeat protein [Akkermansiaceae bacterium]|nr:tetratricopeptide repeat protein [Akkermansiaceae bacterium]